MFLSHGIISVDQEETITIGKNVNNQTDIRLEKEFDGWDFSWQDLKNICSI